MPKISNQDIYNQDDTLSMNDYTIGSNSNTGNKKTQTYTFASIFSLFYNFLGYNAFLNTTDTTTYPIGTPGCFYVFDENDVLTADFSEARKITFSSYDTYNFDTANYFNIIVSSGKFLFKLINLEDKNNFVFLSPSNFVLSETGTTFNVDVLAEAGLSNGSFVNYKRYLLVLEFAAGTFDPAEYDLSDFTNTSGNPFITAQDLTDALALLPTPITNHSGLSLDDGTNPHQTTLDDVAKAGNTTEEFVEVGGIDTPEVRLTNAANYVALKADGLTTDRELFAPDENGIIATKEWTNEELILKLNIADYNDRFKGKYTSLVNLQTAHPTSNTGDYAIVDSGIGVNAIEYIYDEEEGWVQGNSVGSSTTDGLSEGSSNLYFTTARVLATVLSGLSLATGGAIVSTDSILVALGKIQKQIDDLTTSVNNKVDKVTTVDVEKVYIKNADGTQGMKPTSELSLEFDVIKNYPNQIVISATGVGFTNIGTYAQNVTGTQSDILIGGGGVSYRKILSAATAGSNANFYDAGVYRVTGTKGFYYRARIKNDDPTNIPTARFSYGFSGTAIMGNINPSAYVQTLLSFGADNSDTNCQIIYKNSGGGTTKIDLGATMPKTQSDEYVIEFWRLNGTTTVNYRITNLTTSVILSGSFVFAFSGLALGCFRNNNTATTAVSFAIRRVELYIGD